MTSQGGNLVLVVQGTNPEWLEGRQTLMQTDLRSPWQALSDLP